MIHVAHRHRVYRRLETDDEFRACSGYPYSHECNYADCSEDERGIHIKQATAVQP